jgi:hypothetical protein
MSMIISPALACAEQEEGPAALAACWPQFSAAELRRLRFLAYRRATGRLRPPGPLRAAGVRLAEEIAAYLRTPAPPASQPQHAASPDVPPLWRAWMDAQRPPHRSRRPREAAAQRTTRRYVKER